MPMPHWQDIEATLSFRNRVRPVHSAAPRPVTETPNDVFISHDDLDTRTMPLHGKAAIAVDDASDPGQPFSTPSR